MPFSKYKLGTLIFRNEEHNNNKKQLLDLSYWIRKSNLRKLFFKSIKGIEYLPQTLIFESLHCKPNVVDLRYFKIGILLDQRLTQSSCKEIGIRNFKLVAKIQFLYKKNFYSKKATVDFTENGD